MKTRFPGGFLLVIEGIDGAGKTTQASALAEVLQARGLDVLRSREPTDGPWGRRIRESARAGRMSPEEEARAFMEDRRQHVQDIIGPALEAGKVVILDRYYFSTVAYQGARGLDPDRLLRDNETFAIEPHLLALIDLPAEVGLQRVGYRDGRANQFETLAQLRRSREIFLSLRKPYLVVVDGRRPPEEIRDEILVAFSLKAVERIAAQRHLPAAERLRACLGVHGARR